eukprot:3960317-Karenia_brevis.AAC.1
MLLGHVLPNVSDQDLRRTSPMMTARDVDLSCQAPTKILIVAAVSRQSAPKPAGSNAAGLSGPDIQSCRSWPYIVVAAMLLEGRGFC